MYCKRTVLLKSIFITHQNLIAVKFCLQCSLAFVLNVVYVFLLSVQPSKMDNFLQSYKNILREKNIDTFNANDLEFVERDLQTVLSAVVVLLRRHNFSNHLCCNNASDLQVTNVDGYGFVKAVKCMRCNQTMETTCHEAKSTYERIYDKSKLKPGDHICWHRPYAIWHHAIVSKVDGEKQNIHYSSESLASVKVIESDMPENDSSRNALYRVNYQDCYAADYSILRARKLLNESRYELLRRNCEHFIRWCKTGATNSIQLDIFWVSLGKLAFMISLKLIAAVILGLIAYSHEVQEEITKDRESTETLQIWLITVYTIMFTVVFIIYLLITSGSRLHPAGMRCHDDENPRNSCLDQCSKRFDDICCCRCCCGCLSLITFICSSIFCSFDCYSRTCCRRPCNLACGLFWRIVIREILATALTLSSVLNEESITNEAYIAQMSAAARTAILIAYSTLAHAGAIWLVYF